MQVSVNVFRSKFELITREPLPIVALEWHEDMIFQYNKMDPPIKSEDDTGGEDFLLSPLWIFISCGEFRKKIEAFKTIFT